MALCFQLLGLVFILSNKVKVRLQEGGPSNPGYCHVPRGLHRTHERGRGLAMPPVQPLSGPLPNERQMLMVVGMGCGCSATRRWCRCRCTRCSGRSCARPWWRRSATASRSSPRCGHPGSRGRAGDCTGDERGRAVHVRREEGGARMEHVQDTSKSRQRVRTSVSLFEWFLSMLSRMVCPR